MTDKPPHTNTAKHRNQSHQERQSHDSNTESEPDSAASMDPEGARYWREACAALPPMTPEEIAAVAVILRRIDARRNQPPR